MERSAWWYLVMFMLCSSCADRATPPLALVIDERASVAEATTVRRAAEAWNARVGRELFYVPSEPVTDSCDRVVVRFVDEMPAQYDEFSGLFEQVGCHYEVQILHDFGLDQANATHELGHALDLGHNDDKSSVMFWSTRHDSVITDEDVLRVRARWAL